VADDTFRDSAVGFGKPPKHTQFKKGQSGNPKGRPKGSQNIATILAKAGRQLIKVTENGKIRYMTKLQATMLQLMNKNVAGDLKAMTELRCWTALLERFDEPSLPPAGEHESDKTVMKNILERIRNSEYFAKDDAGKAVGSNPLGSEE
jgi:hypothetical protein